MRLVGLVIVVIALALLALNHRSKEGAPGETTVSGDTERVSIAQRASPTVESPSLPAAQIEVTTQPARLLPSVESPEAPVDPDAQFAGCLGCAKDDENHQEIARIFVTTPAGTIWYEEPGGDFRVVRHLVSHNLTLLSEGVAPTETAAFEILLIGDDGKRTKLAVGDSWAASGDLVGPVDPLLWKKLTMSAQERRDGAFSAERFEAILQKMPETGGSR